MAANVSVVLQPAVHLSYDQKLRPYHRTIAKLASTYAPPGARLLDIGCGIGHLPSAIHDARPDIELTAADLDAICLERTAARVPGIETRVIDLSSPSWADFDDTFDVITLSHVLEHMISPDETIRDVLGLLAPAGHAVIAVPNPSRPDVTLSNIVRRDYANRGHVYAWDPSHWRNFLERIVQCDVVEYSADFVKLFPVRLSDRVPLLATVERAAARIVPWWSFSNIAVVAR